MSGDWDGLRAAAEAATAGPWICAEQTHGEWYGIQSRHFALGNVFQANDGAYIAAASPDVVLALLDRLAAAEAAVEGLERRVADSGLDPLDALRSDQGPGEHERQGYLDGLRTAARIVRSALDGPQDAATGEVALGFNGESGEPQSGYRACSGSTMYPTEEKARDWCRLLNGSGGGFWFYWRCDAGHHHAAGVA